MMGVQGEVDEEGASFAFTLTLRPDLAILVQIHNACLIVKDNSQYISKNKTNEDKYR